MKFKSRHIKIEDAARDGRFRDDRFDLDLDPKELKITKQVLSGLHSGIDSELKQWLSEFYSRTFEYPTIEDETNKRGEAYDERVSHLPTLQPQSGTLVHECEVHHFIHNVSVMKKPVPFLLAKSMRVCIIDKEDQNVCYACRISNLVACGVWSPQSEQQREEEFASLYKDDKYLGQFYKTTSKHRLGDGWVGIVEKNLPVLSTTLGGSNHPIPLSSFNHKDKYVIRWIKWNQRKTEFEPVGITGIDRFIQEGLIALANPDEKQHLNRPDVYSPQYQEEPIKKTHRIQQKSNNMTNQFETRSSCGPVKDAGIMENDGGMEHQLQEIFPKE